MLTSDTGPGEDTMVPQLHLQRSLTTIDNWVRPQASPAHLNHQPLVPASQAQKQAPTSESGSTGRPMFPRGSNPQVSRDPWIILSLKSPRQCLLLRCPVYLRV